MCRTIIVRHKIHRPRIDFIEQQSGVGRQTGLGVAHRCGAVAISGAKVTLTIDQRISQGESLGQSHEGVIGRLIAMWMKAAQDIAHDAGTLDRSGGRAQAHRIHRIQNPALNRLQTITNVRQRTALDYGNGVIEVSPLRVTRQGDRLIIARRNRGFCSRQQVIHTLAGLRSAGAV